MNRIAGCAIRVDRIISAAVSDVARLVRIPALNEFAI